MDELAEEIKSSGGFIPGLRPGAVTANYIRDAIRGITLPGALFLAFLAVVPSIAATCVGANLAVTFGGTSLLIIVGVVLDTISSVESQMINYGGLK